MFSSAVTNNTYKILFNLLVVLYLGKQRKSTEEFHETKITI